MVLLSEGTEKVIGSLFNCSSHAQTAVQVRAASVGLDPSMTMALTPCC